MDIDKYLFQKRQEIIKKCKKCHGENPFCDCVLRYNLEIKKVQSNIPEILLDVNIKSLSLSDTCKDKLNKFCIDTNRVLYVEGGGAIERNSVASITLKSFIKKGKTVDYVTPFRLSNIAVNWRKEVFEEYNLLVRTDIIALTDIGDERRSENMSTEKLVNSLLRERIYSDKKTIITSSLALEEFSKEYVKDSSIYGQGFMIITLPTVKSIKDIFKDLREGV